MAGNWHPALLVVAGGRAQDGEQAVAGLKSEPARDVCRLPGISFRVLPWFFSLSPYNPGEVAAFKRSFDLPYPKRTGKLVKIMECISMGFPEKILHLVV
ncbi:hypothetical protein [Cyclobacterium xiamenense]|uniref:hypothetical protein n=1 Tax=Cyclobacterium xiamenense TaxID=1297121 RepID=UPI0012B7E3A2|nr:hypothetical protein [Cyclobacterium xiamenense]